MFTAIVTACLIGVPPQVGCKSWKDMRGPYATEAQCEARGEEMIEFVSTLAPGPFTSEIICKETKSSDVPA